jgi:hypothetical protein
VRIVAYTYLHARYRSYDDGPVGGDVSKSRFPNTPVHQLMLTPLVILPSPLTPEI